jgi:hypothetical protein
MIWFGQNRDSRDKVKRGGYDHIDVMPDRKPDPGRRKYRVSKQYQRYLESEKEEPDTFYERLAWKFSSLKPFDLRDMPFPTSLVDSLDESIDESRLDVTTEDIGSLLLIPLLFLIPVALISFLLVPQGIALILATTPLLWSYWVISYPSFKATVVKIRFSDEALRVILHMALRLERNPNLERAVRASVDYTEGPLSTDLAKIMWDTEIQKRSNIRKAISDRMQVWSEFSPDFVESLELLLDSVAATNDERRRIIDKSQQKMIESVKTKMQQFARNLSSPVKIVNMAGIVLPLMGLIMFPLISIFLSEGQGIGMVTIYLAFGYTVILPMFLFFLIKRLISKRPGAYSHPPLKNVPNLPPKDKITFTVNEQKYQLPLKKTAILVGFIIMIPGILYFADLFYNMITLSTAVNPESGIPTSESYTEFINQQYKVENAVPNIITAMTVFWGAVAGLITYFLGRSYGRKKTRERIEEIENGLELGLTEMENAFSKGKPAERVVYDVINKYDEVDKKEHPLRSFFAQILNLIQQQGFKFRKAVFDEKQGAINYYPSDLLRNSLRVVTSSISKGPKKTAEAIRSVNKYISNKRETEEVINRLLDETVTQLKIQAKYISPIITAMAASVATVIVQVLYGISQQLEALEEQLSVGGQTVSSGLTENIAIIQNIDSAVPPTVLLLIVSTYCIEVSIILAYFSNGIENGFDPINRDIQISKNLIYSCLIFSIITLVAAVQVTPFIAGVTST